MCKVLADLLGIDDPLFSIGVHQLEQASGQPGIDVRLYSEIIRRSHQKTRELGLDPRDTTAEELYHALIGLVKKHDEFLAKRLGGQDAGDVHDLLPRIQSFISHLDTPKQVWVLKPSTAKRIIKATPPRKIMKQLGYRSVDSMLKREPVGELFVAMRFVESPEWLRSFAKKYKHLSPRDFETRDVEFLYLDAKKWGVTAESYVRGQHHNVTHMKEMGVIALLPLPVGRLPGITITLLPLLLYYLNEIRMYSAFFKLQQVRPDFGETLARTLAYDPHNHVKVAGHEVHWRTVHRHLGKQETENRANHPETFEPHVQPEDLFWRGAEDVLYRIEPALHFWHNMDYVAAKQGGIVSFNLMDAAICYVNNLSYAQRTIHHFQAGLWNELFARYIGEPALEYQVLQQLTPQSNPVSMPDSNSILEELFI
ncbi:MAG TPA: hypothetical protein VK674_00675 [Candidatus Limnocylindria bacterium]|nr:hypothetical protein [Candidatus Limnocylindria bacterium]